MTAPVPASPAREPVRTRAARVVIMLGAAISHALFVEATWIEPRFGTGELRVPPPPSWAVTSVHLVKGGVGGLILGAVLTAAVEAACAAVQTVTAWSTRP